MKRDFLTFLFLVSFAIFGISCSSNQKDTELKKADLFYTYGTQKMIDKDYTQALEALQNSNKLKPNDTKTLNNLGLAYFFKNRPQQAKKYFEQAIKADDKNSDARNNLASIYFREGKIDLAEQQYQEVLKDLVYQYSYRVQYNLALIELKRGNKKKAVDYLNQVLGYTLDYCPASYQLAMIYKQEGNITKAIKNLNIATTGKCEKEPAAIYELGEVYRSLGEDKKALALYNKIIEGFPRTEYAQKSLSIKNKLVKKVYYSNKNNYQSL